MAVSKGTCLRHRRSAVFSFSNKSAVIRIAGRKSHLRPSVVLGSISLEARWSCEDLPYRHTEVYFQPLLARDFKFARVES